MISLRFRSKSDLIENPFVKKIIQTFCALDQNGKIASKVSISILPKLTTHQHAFAVSEAQEHNRNEPFDGRTFDQIKNSTILAWRLEIFCESLGFIRNSEQHVNDKNGHDVSYAADRGDFKAQMAGFGAPLELSSKQSRLTKQCYLPDQGGSDFWIMLRIIDDDIWLDGIISKEFLIRKFDLRQGITSDDYSVIGEIKSYLLYHAPDCLVLNKNYPPMSDETLFKKALLNNNNSLIVF